MTITLRELATGKPVGASDIATDRVHGAKYVIDNWSVGACKVYARLLPGRPGQRLVEFDPSRLGLYIGHERGEPISAIKWGDPAASGGLWLTKREREIALAALIFETENDRANDLDVDPAALALIERLKGV